MDCPETDFNLSEDEEASDGWVYVKKIDDARPSKKRKVLGESDDTPPDR